MTSRSRTIVIVGAGFSGAALTFKLLRRAQSAPLRIVLVERAARFGPGLAYSDRNAGAVLNVPAGRMSIDESQPDDLLDYLRMRELPFDPDSFIPRTLYGDYIEARLHDSARAAVSRVQFTRMRGDVVALHRAVDGSFWDVQLEDGRSVLADTVVLALGHFPPQPVAALRPIVDSGLYVNDPWSQPSLRTPADRVLLVGTGLTMADVACELSQSSYPPSEIVALSRRGLVPQRRRSNSGETLAEDYGLDELQQQAALRRMVAVARKSAERAIANGNDWRQVVLDLRGRMPTLWGRLSAAEKRRFLRHLQPYWDIHRHQLPPQVGRQLQELVDGRQLAIRAGRILSAQISGGRAVVTFLPRGEARPETEAFDRIINCSGPDADPRRAGSRLVGGLFAQGQAAACPTGTGLQVDAECRVIGASGAPTSELYYVGPWLKGRDFEATAVHELRGQATALAELLTSRIPVATSSPRGMASIIQTGAHAMRGRGSGRQRHDLHP